MHPNDDNLESAGVWNWGALELEAPNLEAFSLKTRGDLEVEAHDLEVFLAGKASKL